MSADIRQVEPGAFALSGVLDYQSGPAVRAAGAKLIRAAHGDNICLDCSGVVRSSSVGLSLLLCFIRDAHACGKRLQIAGMPAEMQQIAGVSGVDKLLAGAD